MLNGQIVLVTGASRGIGNAIALTLGGSGATQGDGFAMGGLLTGAASSFTNKTEEFTAADPSALNIKTLTTS